MIYLSHKLFIFRYGWKCNICMKELVSLMPCKKCSVAVFCSDECQGNILHQYECGLRFCNDSEVNGRVMRTVRSCLSAIKMFPSIDELIKFVDQTVKSDRNEVPTNLSDAKSQYAAFLKLPIKPDPTAIKDELWLSYAALQVLLGISKVNGLFQSEQSRRFLVHLIVNHHQILQMNSSGAMGQIDDKKGKKSVWISTQVSITGHYFKHSCAPNVLMSTFNGNTVVIAIRPIRKGAQLHDTLRVLNLDKSTKERRQTIWGLQKTICKCERCSGVTASKAQRKRMRLDADFVYLKSNKSNLFTQKNVDVTQIMFDRCKRLLQTYGQLPWCNELGTTMKMYLTLIYTRHRGITTSETTLQNNF